MLDAGTDESFGTADDKLTVEFGSWNDSSLRPADWPSVAADTVTLRNPTALAVLIPNPKVEPKREFLITGWWNNSGSEPYENSLVRNQNRLAGNTTYASTAWLNNSHSNSRGMRALDGTSVPFNLSWESALPLKTLPVAPGAGIAASADGKRIFFSDTRRGQIYTTFLDYDGDGIADVEDNDIDGDLLTNAVEGKLNQYSPKSISPVASQAPDPLMWANTSISVPSPGNRIEWWIDRVNAVTSIDSSLEVPILPEEDGLFTLFNNETVVIANGRGAMHSTPVWPGGPDRDTELNGTTGLPLLSPIVMGSRTPDKNTIKDVSGYDHCNWDTFGADYDSASLNAQGVPSTTCRTESVNLPKTRRAHLALWANYVLPFASLDLTSDGKNDQLFIDWDGDGVRNPVLINNQRVSAVSRRPLMAYIGNLPDSVCPGSFAIAELATLRPALSDSSSPISPNEDNEPQYRCAQTIPFYTTSASQVASVMLDHHLEWTTSSTKSTISYPSVIGDRLSLGTSGDGDPTGTIGPVAETAYQILERSLPVTKRESLSAPQSAMVEISTAAGEYGLAEITVSYRWGFGPMMSIFFGEEATTISAKAQRRVYNFNRSS